MAKSQSSARGIMLVLCAKDPHDPPLGDNLQSLEVGKNALCIRQFEAGKACALHALHDASIGGDECMGGDEGKSVKRVSAVISLSGVKYRG